MNFYIFILSFMSVVGQNAHPQSPSNAFDHKQAKTEKQRNNYPDFDRSLSLDTNPIQQPMRKFQSIF